jgi:hypothetical protein
MFASDEGAQRRPDGGGARLEFGGVGLLVRGRSMPPTVAAEGGAKLANICRFRSAFALFLRSTIFFDSNA